MDEIVFKKLLEKIFIRGDNIVCFDKNEKISVPDCFCRTGNIIYSIEFKDFLFKGEMYQTYSYDIIKKAIDTKLITVITQIKKQINNYINKRDEFPCDRTFSRTSSALIIYPIIVHTNYLFSLPGIQQYLNRLLKIELNAISVPANITIRDLTLINLETFVLHYYNFIEDSIVLSSLIERYSYDTQKDLQIFLNNPSLDNYTISYRSFDIEYAEKYKDESKDLPVDFIDVIREITGIDQDFYNLSI